MWLEYTVYALISLLTPLHCGPRRGLGSFHDGFTEYADTTLHALVEQQSRLDRSAASASNRRIGGSRRCY